MQTLDRPTRGALSVLQTPRIRALVSTAQQSPPGTPLLIYGEPGVGKDVLARLVHAASPRQPYPFIKVNCRDHALQRCGADLFGHERGVDPLELRRRLGSFELAHHGTIYLDEIGALPRNLVAALIQALRTGEVSRAGGREATRVDVRVIASAVAPAATDDQDVLWRELRRLDTTDIWIPPLRQRSDEIPDFASFFSERFGRQYHRDVRLCPEAMAAFGAREWRGNVRELEEAVHELARARA
jgi:DNA-binding NtrC family response regulator